MSKHSGPSAKPSRSRPSTGRQNARPSGERPSTRTRSAPLNPQIMRQTRFAGKLHRGPVSDESVVDVCAVKRECGGCAYINTDYASSLQQKFTHELKLIKDSGMIEAARILDPIPSPNTTAYRALFKLAVRPAPGPFYGADRTAKRFAIGLFEPGTHNIGVNMVGCPLHVAPLTWLLTDIESEIELSALSPWNEQKNTGDLRYIVARASHVTGEIMLTWVVAKPVKTELLKLTQKLRRLGHKVNAAFMNINIGTGNAIFGEEIIHLAGGTGLRENICDLDLEISPTSFFQVNPWQASNLYRRVELHAGTGKAGALAWDLYTGTGQIGLILARAGFRTIGIEEVPEAIVDAKQNALRNKLATKIDFIAGRVEDSESKVPEWGQSPSVIVVNPSRRGLHETARAHLAHVLKLAPECKFIYVSCEAATMARDLKALGASGHRVRQVEAFDMFAQTDKLEWIAVMTK
ncbi:MAG: 23S rRNA (uracil(1939)-C(5))-methyltransferase RlmD [Proteobacteria bacterium]|nr:23S rRNA (uracil(1939)-C(5))-methyltransferase RlmD [Pseudomonadota bacterium]